MQSSPNWELTQVDSGLDIAPVRQTVGQWTGRLSVMEVQISKQINYRRMARVWWKKQHRAQSAFGALKPLNVYTVSQQTTKPHMGVVKPTHKVVPMETWLTHTYTHSRTCTCAYTHTHTQWMVWLVGQTCLLYTDRLEGTVLLSRATSLSKAQTDIRHPALFLSGSGQGKSASQRERQD